MRRWVFWSGLFALLASAALGLGAPLEPGQRAVETKLEAYRSSDYWRKFEAGKRATVVAVGATGSGLLGLYVFDADGNCVGHDDNVTERTRDDTVVEWMPAQTGLYTVEVRSLTRHENKLLMTVRQEPADHGDAAEAHP